MNTQITKTMKIKKHIIVIISNNANEIGKHSKLRDIVKMRHAEIPANMNRQ